ncbi:MAG TPA: sigma-70 family RNA polymerase sigma factor [Allosphingosinicella sp.]
MTLLAQSVRAVPEEEEQALWRAVPGKDGAAARQKLFSIHLPFARRIASRHFLDRTSGDLEFADLFQLACAGLLEAIDLFDPGRGVPFRGYAARRIGGSVIDGIARTSEVREQISFRNRVRRERLRSLAPDRDPDHMDAGRAVAALAEIAVGMALGFMLEGTGLYLPENAPDSRSNAYESLAWKELVGRVGAEVGRLPKREQDVIRHHYAEGLCFDRIGSLLGLSRSRVSQLHGSALALIRKRLAHAGEFRLER